MLRWFRDPSGCTAVSMSSCQPRASKKFIREIAQTDCRLLIVKKDLPIDGARIRIGEAHTGRISEQDFLSSLLGQLMLGRRHAHGAQFLVEVLGLVPIVADRLHELGIGDLRDVPGVVGREAGGESRLVFRLVRDLLEVSVALLLSGELVALFLEPS